MDFSRTVELYICLGCKGPLEIIYCSSPPMGMDQVAQDLIHPWLFQGWRIHYFSGQSVPVSHFSQQE